METQTESETKPVEQTKIAKDGRLIRTKEEWRQTIDKISMLVEQGMDIREASKIAQTTSSAFYKWRAKLAGRPSNTNNHGGARNKVFRSDTEKALIVEKVQAITNRGTFTKDACKQAGVNQSEYYRYRNELVANSPKRSNHQLREKPLKPHKSHAWKRDSVLGAVFLLVKSIKRSG